MKKAVFTLIFALCSSPVFAALPPLAQNFAELKAMLADEQFYKLLNGAQSIEDIRKTDHGYLVHTLKGDYFVEVIYKPSQRVGPIQFDLRFSKVNGDAG